MFKLNYKLQDMMYALIIRLNSIASIPAGTKCPYQVNVYEQNHMQLQELLLQHVFKYHYHRVCISAEADDRPVTC